MSYNTYSSNIYSILTEIQNQLVAADGVKFVAQDVGGASNKVAFLNTIESKYIMIRADKITYSSAYYYQVQVWIGTSWDSTNKVPSGTLEKYGAGIAQQATSSGDLSNTIFNVRTYSHQLYVDKDGVYWNFYNPYTDYTNTGFLIRLEFFTTAAKEYNDASSGIIFQNTQSPTSFSDYTNYQFYNSGQVGVVQSVSNMTNETPLLNAFKSIGNNKVYFEFPRYHNNPTTYSCPIAQTKRWFLVAKVGLASNDIISWLDPDLVTIHKFIVCEVGGARGTIAGYYIALPYDNPVMYS